jgi:hypothetical protein
MVVRQARRSALPPLEAPSRLAQHHERIADAYICVADAAVCADLALSYLDRAKYSG